jgi:protoporphyrinogen oxidase
MFRNNNYDIIILGGGISGLFLAHKLSEIDLSIMLIEKSKEYGGRIHSVKHKGVSYEAGAARFHSSHLKLISLIDELKLGDKKFKLPPVLKHILRNKERNYQYKTKNHLDLEELLKESIEKKDDFDEDKLHEITFFQYLISVFDFETAMFMKDAFGYDSEFLDLNADSALQMFEEDLFSDNDYYVLNGGLSQIIDKLVNGLKKKSNVVMYNDCELKEINKRSIEIPQGKFYFKKLICAIPPSSLQKIDYFKDNDELNYVKPIPLLRIYAKYPVKDKSVWFKNIKRTTTDNYIRHVIPIDYDSGLIMISYTDGYYTSMWENLYSCGEDILIKHLHKEIEDLYQIKPPDPEFIKFHYWKHGFHVWKPGNKMNDVYETIMQPDEKVPIFICGEGFSKKQGWIEGCLETCYDIIYKLDLPNVEIIRETMDNEIKDKKDKKEKKKTEDKKTYSIDEVIKHKNWIVFEINGEKRIYNIQKWISKHPGGKIILQGVKATKDYYKDNEGESPTEMFKNIGKHGKLSSFINARKEYIELKGILQN